MKEEELAHKYKHTVSAVLKYCATEDRRFAPTKRETYRSAVYLDYVFMFVQEFRGRPVPSFDEFCESVVCALLDTTL